METARRENKTLAGEVKALSGQLGSGAIHELEKAKKRLEAEGDELTEQLEVSTDQCACMHLYGCFSYKLW